MTAWNPEGYPLFGCFSYRVEKRYHEPHEWPAVDDRMYWCTGNPENLVRRSTQPVIHRYLET